MKITFWKGVFVAEHSPADERTLKGAGFQLHEPTLCEPEKCRACRARIGRRYWSARVEDATRLRSHCTERALSVMKDHLRKLAQSRATDAQITVPTPEGLSLVPYQKAGVAYAIQHKDTLFGDDMGLGKTVESIGVVNYLRSRQVLVVCPATLVLNWRAEVRKWSTTKFRFVIPRTTSEKVPNDDVPTMVIVSYEKILGRGPRRSLVDTNLVRTNPEEASRASRMTQEQLSSLLKNAATDDAQIPVLVREGGGFRAARNSLVVEAARLLGVRTPSLAVPPELDVAEKDLDAKKVKKIVTDTPLSKSLRSRRWDVGIYDEAQALKNPESRRSRAVLAPGGLFHVCKRNLFLSGTPLENYPKEIWPIASTVCPARFGEWWPFARRYCGLHTEVRGGKTRWVSDGSTRPLELQQRLRTSFMIRRLKKDVLPELPPKRRQLVVLDEEVDWSAYPEFRRWRELYEQDEAAYDAALARLEEARTYAEYVRAAKALETVSIPFVETSDCRHKTGLLKLPACLRHADQMLDAGLDCLVIYAHHVDVLEKIHDHYGKGESCIIYGDTRKEDRMATVEAFQEGRKRIFIGGLRAAGVGITLTRASTVSFFETDWNPATMVQGEDRLCRFGQKKMVHVIHPVLDGSIDANMISKILRKQSVIDKVLDQLPDAPRQ